MMVSSKVVFLTWSEVVVFMADYKGFFFLLATILTVEIDLSSDSSSA